MERQFSERGLERAAKREEAGIVVLNTCTVTAAADQDARAAIRRIYRENPECQILVTGCYAQRAPQEIADLPGVKWVVGNSHKQSVAEVALSPAAAKASSSLRPLSTRLEACRDTHQASEVSFVPVEALTENRELPTENRIFVSDIFAHTELLAAPVFDAANGRTRPNLKVQDGCDNRCSFCIIPYVRGQSRSLQLDEVIHEVTQLVAAGYREIVISGINLGRWGRDFSRPMRFQDLVSAILDRTPLEKLRISSVEPMDCSDRLIRLVAGSPRIAKHAHVPMQSGSDQVLRTMHRKYRPWHYREKIERIRASMPAAAIGADVMVGFPGETDSEFEDTRRIIEELPFTYLHVFTYSARPGTPAAALPNQTPLHVARERNRILRDLAGEKHGLFMRSFIGKTIDAITLNTHVGTAALGGPAEQSSAEDFQPSSSFTSALADNYLKLRLHGYHEPNRWITAKIASVDGDTLTGFVG